MTRPISPTPSSDSTQGELLSAIRELNATLEQRVEERTLELANANEMLQREIAERQRREATLRAVWQISEAVHAVVDLDHLFARIHAIIGDLMPARNFYLALLDERTASVSFPYYTDEISSPPPPRAFGMGLTEYVLRTRRPLLATQAVVERLTREGEHVPHGPPAAVWLGTPLFARGQPIGVMAVQDYSDPHAFGEDEQQLFIFVAEQTALAIERKRAETELLQTLARERELGELRKSFVSMVSHEFRTPLGIITSSAGLLEDYFNRLDPEERREYLVSIRSASRRMSQLMESVLLFGAVEEGRYSCEPRWINPAELCQTIAEEVAAAMGDRCPVEFKAARLPVEAPLDDRLLRPALTNLLGNAIKYSPPGVAVEFTASAENNELAFVIRDRGCGIPAADVPNLFEPFRRGSNVTHVSGTGLGLAIVHRCVRLHSGGIEVTSKVGRGTVVTVRIPLPPPETDTPATPPAAPTSAHEDRPRH